MDPFGVSLPAFLLCICTLQGVLEPVLPVLLILQEVGAGYTFPFQAV